MMIAALGRSALAAVAVIVALAPVQAQDTRARIKEKGVLVAGVKNDYKPWGFLDPSGKIVGLEIDLAADVATGSASSWR